MCLTRLMICYKREMREHIDKKRITMYVYMLMKAVINIFQYKENYFLSVFLINSFCKIIKNISKAIVVMKKYMSLKKENSFLFLQCHSCEKHTFQIK